MATNLGFACQRLALVLVRPTRYDDDGYVVRHWRGTLPSNTLSCLNGLTGDVVARGSLAPVAIDVHVLDEAVDRVDPARLVRRLRRPGTLVLVALAGVQTNQFPRAQDLARRFKREGCEVMIGGFHVSGSIALSPGMPPECQAMLDEGVTLVAGEVEEHWGDLLGDAAMGRLRPFYNFLAAPPDLRHKALPRNSLRLQRRFAVRGYGTIDAGRGCPFNCSFCTIINVQGRTMRSRGAARIIDHVRNHHGAGRRHGIWHYFFTDDNFSRNPEWEAILDGLIALRHDEGRPVDFMMQVDMAAARIPRFVDKAAKAGCVQVFIGMESLREDNLIAAGKRQNRVGQYRESIARWHDAGVVCHVGFIIGFPFDTYDRIMEDVATLRDDVLVDQASFFILTPLPGSHDHRAAVNRGVVLDPDYNNYDSFRPTTPHARMSREEWIAAYRDAWTSFYSVDHMRQALLRQNPHTYWGMFKCFLWYRAAMLEGAHPMVTGFVRLKDRCSRRPGLPIEGRLTFLRRRIRDAAKMAVAYWTLLLEMQELWLTTRIRRGDYTHFGEFRSGAVARMDFKTHWSRLHGAIRERVSSVQLGNTMTERLEALRRATGRQLESPAGASTEAILAEMGDRVGVQDRSASRRRRFVAWLNPARAPTPEVRRDLTRYWSVVAARMRRGQVLRVNPISVVWNAAREIRSLTVFLTAMALERH